MAFLADIENQITEENCDRIQAKIIAEGAGALSVAAALTGKAGPGRITFTMAEKGYVVVRPPEATEPGRYATLRNASINVSQAPARPGEFPAAAGSQGKVAFECRIGLAVSGKITLNRLVRGRSESDCKYAAI